MFFSRKPVGIAAFHMTFQVEFVGGHSQATAFVAEISQTFDGVATVASRDVELDMPRVCWEGLFRGKNYYQVEVVVEDREKLASVIDMLTSKCIFVEEPAHT